MKRLFSAAGFSAAAVFVTVFGLSACNNSASDSTQESSDSTSTAVMTIEPMTSSPKFPDAVLSIAGLTAKMKGKDSATVTIKYKVENYQLTGQTEDAAHKGCSNSKDGQHIHFILDNQPYVALYRPENTFVVPVNQPQYLMSFLSRSYHESVKAPKAGVLLHFSVDKNGKVNKLADPVTPMLFYSRPKGEYAGADARNILLDFYVYHADLGKNALVKAIVNDTSFSIDKWQAYFIKNAPEGDLKISLQLTDTAGVPLSGDNTAVSRTVKVKP
ncbi:MAG TPA: hypothetical protein VFL76_05690 [Edaphocola sp.]|nr:hypothetical protein [Edaphocola sp.]